MEAPLATQPQKERSQVERPMERLQLDKPARESSNDESTDSGSNPPGDGFFRGGYQVCNTACLSASADSSGY